MLGKCLQNIKNDLCFFQIHHCRLRGLSSRFLETKETHCLLSISRCKERLICTLGYIFLPRFQHLSCNSHFSSLLQTWLISIVFCY